MTENSSHRLVQSVLVSLNGVIGEPLTWAGPYFGEGSAIHSQATLQRTSTLREAEWNNTTLVCGDVVEAVRTLKQSNDLLFYGHGQFGQTLVDAGLVDELTLTLVPVSVPGGTPLFRHGGESRRWELVQAGPGHDPGLVSLTYRPASSDTVQDTAA